VQLSGNHLNISRPLLQTIRCSWGCILPWLQPSTVILGHHPVPWRDLL